MVPAESPCCFQRSTRASTCFAFQVTFRLHFGKPISCNARAACMRTSSWSPGSRRRYRDARRTIPRNVFQILHALLTLLPLHPTPCALFRTSLGTGLARTVDRFFIGTDTDA